MMKKTYLLVAIILYGFSLIVATPLLGKANEFPSPSEHQNVPKESISTITQESSSPEYFSPLNNLLVTKEAVIGTDDQTPVTDLHNLPYRAVVSIETYYPSYVAVSSGVLIAPNLVLTAGHSMYKQASREWPLAVSVRPASSKEQASPYGNYSVTDYYVLRKYLSAGENEPFDDMAIIRLDRNVEGAGYLNVSTQVTTEEELQIVGYPVDTPSKDGTMYTSFGRLSAIEKYPNLLSYSIDAEGGQSGGPIINRANQVVGIHIVTEYTDISRSEVVENHGRKIKEDTLEMLELAKNRRSATGTVARLGETYRLYHPGIKRHLYTQNFYEAQILSTRGWNHEGGKFITPSYGTPVYRLYHSGTKEHLYTTSTHERDILSQRSWRYEGIAWYATEDRAQAKPIYRLYHPGLKVHLYTMDQHESNVLRTRGWQYEGISFYVLP